MRMRSLQENGKAGGLVVAVVLSLVLATTTVVVTAQDDAGVTIPETVLSFTVLDTMPLPTTGRVTGLTWMGTDTLVVLADYADSLTASGNREVKLVFQDSTGTVFLEEDFSGVLDRGLAWDGEFLWSCGDDAEGGSLLYKIKADTVRVEEVYPTQGHRPMSLAFDGRWLWLTDRDNGRIDRIDPETGDLTRSVGAPGFSPVGLAWDGTAMWVTDSATGRLTRMRGNRLQRRDEVAADAWFLRDRDARLAHDGRSLWVLRAGDHHLQRLVPD